MGYGTDGLGGESRREALTRGWRRDRGCIRGPRGVAPTPGVRGRSPPARWLDQSFIDVAVRPYNPHAAIVAASTSESEDAGAILYRNQLYVTTDDGAHWAAYGDPLDPTFSLETVEVSASDPHRVYVTGERVSPSHTAVLFTSTSDATNWVESVVPLLPANEDGAFIAAVDPKDPDRVYLRTGEPFAMRPGRLLVSDDAGGSFTQRFAGKGPLQGFVLVPDGSYGPRGRSERRTAGRLDVRLCFRPALDDAHRMLGARGSVPPRVFVGHDRRRLPARRFGGRGCDVPATAPLLQRAGAAGVPRQLPDRKPVPPRLAGSSNGARRPLRRASQRATRPEWLQLGRSGHRGRRARRGLPSARRYRGAGPHPKTTGPKGTVVMLPVVVDSRGVRKQVIGVQKAAPARAFPTLRGASMLPSLQQPRRTARFYESVTLVALCVGVACRSSEGTTADERAALQGGYYATDEGPIAQIAFSGTHYTLLRSDCGAPNNCTESGTYSLDQAGTTIVLMDDATKQTGRRSRSKCCRRSPRPAPYPSLFLSQARVRSNPHPGGAQARRALAQGSEAHDKGPSG